MDGEVAAALDIPVAGGEQDYDLQQWKRIVDMRAVDIAQPDVCYIGGVTRALAAAKLAEAAGLPCVPHSANHSLVTVFTLHLMGALPNAGPHVEFSIEDQPWVDGLYAAQAGGRGRQGDDPGRTGLGRGDQPGVAGERGAHRQRVMAIVQCLHRYSPQVRTPA